MSYGGKENNRTENQTQETNRGALHLGVRHVHHLVFLASAAPPRSVLPAELFVSQRIRVAFAQQQDDFLGLVSLPSHVLLQNYINPNLTS